jgi:hypothetical protein
VSLLREIQQAAADSTTAIGTLLRKAKILAAKLQNAEFADWVNRELNGYPDTSTLPPYRIVHVIVRGVLSDGYRRWNYAPIMTSFLPETLRGWGETAYLPKPISEYASLLELPDDGEVQCPWPQEIAVRYGAKGYNRMECLGAWQIISRNSLVGLIETVRNRILDFALEIEMAAPDAGEALPGHPPIAQDKVTQMFTTLVMGGVNNISSGGSNVQQSNSGQLAAGDLDSLLSYLRDVGVSASSVDELKQNLESAPDKKAAAEGVARKAHICYGH